MCSLVEAENPKVISVFPNEQRKAYTTHSWDFLSLEKAGMVPSGSLWRKARFGEDVIIANIDYGVWPESASFRDQGHGPIPSRWKGSCEQDDDGSPFPCNRKLIGAKYFYEGFVKEKHLNNLTVHFPRDYYGHGTHTLSTAGGNFVQDASVLGVINGTIKGGLTKARLAAYKVCHGQGYGYCFDADILKAFDHAIDDGVEVISISLGGFGHDYYNNGIAVGAFHAVQHGIPVIASGGNDGPEYGSVDNVAPWIITVAASTTDRDIVNYVHLHNGVRLKGKSISELMPEQRFYPLIRGVDAKLVNASAWEATLRRLRALDPEKVKGNILICLLGEIPEAAKSKNAALAGAIGMILCNDKDYGDNLQAEAHFLPTAQISYSDGLSVFAYMNSTKNPLGLITPPKAEFGIRPAPTMASFSSQGPNRVNPEILKSAPAMKTHPQHICSTNAKKCVEKEETGVDCSTASSCDSSPSFIEIYSKKRKMVFTNVAERHERRKNKGKEKLTSEPKREGPNQIWSPANVIYFIDEMYKLWQQGMLLGNNISASMFSSLAISMEINAPVKSHVPWNGKQLATKARSIRADWRKYHELLTKQTGWGVDPETGFIQAPEGAWEAYCEAHPTFDKELINKPFLRYDICTDMWATMTATGQYAAGGSSVNPVDVDDDSQPTRSKSSGKRSAPHWRDDDPTGVVKQKIDIAESVKCSLNTWGQMNATRLKTLEEDHIFVDLSTLNDEVITFVDEVGFETCIRALDILIPRKDLAFSWLRWPRGMKLVWLQKYAS